MTPGDSRLRDTIPPRPKRAGPDPAPTPAPVAVATGGRNTILHVLAALAVGLLLWQRFDPPGGAVDPVGGQVLSAKQIGQGARQAFATTHAAALRTAADRIERGDDLGQVQADMATEWAKARSTAFDTLAVPALNKIVPPGTETPTAAQRAGYATFLRAVAEAESK